MPKVYDDALKKLFRANAQDFVSLIQEGLHVERLLPTELDAEHIFADGLAMCHDEHGQEQLAHFEFQREKDERMGERLLEYNILASRLNNYLPVATCVINLKKVKNAPCSPLIRTLRNGMVNTRFYYASIDLGELTVKEFREKMQDKASFLPLLPLTDGGSEPEAIDIMVEGLIAADRTDLLWIGYALAAKVFSDDKKDLKWLKRRFALMNDFLWDSPIYQELMTEAKTESFAEGKAEGKAEGIETGKMQALSQMSQELLNYIDARFPSLKELAQKCVSKIDDNAALLQLGMKISAVQSTQEAKKILRSSLKA